MESLRNKMKISIPDIDTNESRFKELDHFNGAVIIDEQWEIKVRICS